jgi:GNAT superfamily N-acetyltransferase
LLSQDALALIPTLSSHLSLPEEDAIFRPLLPQDVEPLGLFFLSLSESTRRRYWPHALDEKGARVVCSELDSRRALRMVAFSRASEAIIVAYFIIEFELPATERSRYLNYGIQLSEESDCRLAPVVADARQNTGVGSVLMQRTLETTRQLDRRRVILYGGVQAANHRAIHFYEKFGFKRVGTFHKHNRDNIDMLLNLR